jgi:hypothetical protein
VHGVRREPGHYGFRGRRASTSARVRHRLAQDNEIHLTFLPGSRLVESTENVVTNLHVFRPLDEQKGEDEQQHPMVRDRCGPGTSQRPPPWRPARTLTETAGSSSTTTLPWNPTGSPSRGPALRVGCCRARPGLESTDSPGVSSLAPRGHLQEWLMS